MCPPDSNSHKESEDRHPPTKPDRFRLSRFFPSSRKARPKPAPGLAQGVVVGDFRLIELIGQGGMGQVWEAEQLSLGDRRVAVKFVRPERVSAQQLDYFRREARAGGRLCHPGIVAIHGYGEEGPMAWIAMEYVPGDCSLRDSLARIVQDGEFPPDYDRHAALLVAQVAEAMEAAHTAGVIHRDLKPENILVTPDDLPKVTDFGLARIIDESCVSDTGDFAGSYYYMSPEQVAAKRAGLDHRTDIFSLGATLYELLTLRRPFEGESVLEVSNKILFEEPVDPSELRPDIPEELIDICLRALEKHPDDRFQSMSELAHALHEFLGDGAASDSRHAATAGLQLADIWRTPWAGGVAAVAIALIAGGWFWVGQRSPARAGQTSPENSETTGRGLVPIIASRSPSPEALLQLRENLEELAAGQRPFDAVVLARETKAAHPCVETEKLVQESEKRAIEELSDFVQYTSPAANEILGSSSVVIRGTVARTDSSESLFIDDVSVQLEGTSFERNLGVLADGLHEVQIEVRHSLGLLYRRTLSFVVDTLPPVLTIEYPTEGSVVPAAFKVTGQVQDTTATTILFGSGTVEQSPTGAWEIDVSLEPGNRELPFTATDAYGRTSSSVVSVIVDAQHPVILDPGGGFEVPVRSNDTVIQLRATDDHAISSVFWDDQSVLVSDEGLMELPILSNAAEATLVEHQLRVIDGVGNETHRTVYTRVDRTAPLFEFSPEDGTTVKGVFPGSTYVLRGTAHDQSRCFASLNGGEQVPVSEGVLHATTEVPVDAVPGTAFALRVVLFDEVGNETIREKSLSVLQPCSKCTAVDGRRGLCVRCDGEGSRDDQCRAKGCRGGSIEGTCPDCKGRCRIECALCLGEGVGNPEACLLCTSGLRPCSRCQGHGRYDQDCSKCKGNGWLPSGLEPTKCKRCNTTGKRETQCEKCEGKCTEDCHACDEGWSRPPCLKCKDGLSDVPCPTCEGEGVLHENCEACGGDGKIPSKCKGCRGEEICKYCKGTGEAR